MTDEDYEITRDGTMTRDEARALTDEIKEGAATVWKQLLTLYNGNAHTALGYPSWASYCAVEFDLGGSAAYRMLNAGRVMDQLENGKRHSPNGGVAPLPTNERVLRELEPALRADGSAEEAWSEAVERHGPKPTAKQVKEIVRGRQAPPPAPPKPIKPSWAIRIEALAGELAYIVKFPDDGEQIATALALMTDVRADLEQLLSEVSEP